MFSHLFRKCYILDLCIVVGDKTRESSSRIKHFYADTEACFLSLSLKTDDFERKKCIFFLILIINSVIKAAETIVIRAITEYNTVCNAAIILTR